MHPIPSIPWHAEMCLIKVGKIQTLVSPVHAQNILQIKQPVEHLDGNAADRLASAGLDSATAGFRTIIRPRNDFQPCILPTRISFWRLPLPDRKSGFIPFSLTSHFHTPSDFDAAAYSLLLGVSPRSP